MKASEIRQRFLDFFAEREHTIRPSSSLVPRNDPTLLFTNAGMVQFKGIFLGQESVPYHRAVTSQKCVRAGGKHNDLEQVGETARHHTFFEMLGNFSFGDYFKRDAIRYAWDFLTDDLGLDPDRLFVTVHHTDEEAAELWQEVVGIPADRIYRLGDKDNFWQMADTGPCGPCSEIHWDARSPDLRGTVLPTEEFEEAGERGEFLELWNLVFMQFDRDQDGVMHPLPAPSIDTGAGLERLAAVLQNVDSNYHTDLFAPLLEVVGEVVGRPYDPDSSEAVSYRVLADHARSVAFLLADGVFPSSEGRGYVLRRILRRAVRHAWLLGRREPTLVDVVDGVVRVMGDAYPELRERRDHLLRTTRAEEERFLTTIEGGLDRFDEVAPEVGSDAENPTIPGEEVFKLYDTFGFPLDLTELMARERGYQLDVPGFEAALERQRARSRADRATADLSLGESDLLEGWTEVRPDLTQAFVGYSDTELDTSVLAYRLDGDRSGLVLQKNPFYLESGGQVSDTGTVTGEGWSLTVEQVATVGGRTAVLGPVTGTFPATLPDDGLEVIARVFPRVRHDTERNHTATHLLHAALRQVLGEHVVQRGSLVAPDRLRFDFSHTAPMTPQELQEVETLVNAEIWDDHPVAIGHMAYAEAVDEGAMALFGEKYGDEVRVVRIPGVSMELCGGTHVRHTGEIGLFKITGESGVAAGVRRIEAATGPGAFRFFQAQGEALREVAETLRTPVTNLRNRAEQVLEERGELERLLTELRKGEGGGGAGLTVQEVSEDGGAPARVETGQMKALSADDVRMAGDQFRESNHGAVRVVAAELSGDKRSLFAFVTDDLVSRGVRADVLVRHVAEIAEGRGGGRPHMAQASIGNPDRVDEALASAARIVQELLSGAAK